MRRVQVPQPGGRRELDELIGRIASTPLNRRRPLWEMYFVEGMAAGRVAVITKIHHALADGVASANLMARAMEWPESSVPEHDLATVNGAPSTARLLFVALRDHLGQIARMPSVLKASLVGVARLSQRVATRAGHPRDARAFRPSTTFMNHKLSSRRVFGSATLALAEVKQMSKDLGITVNDLVLATVTGALRELLHRYDGGADRPIIASVPISTDTSRDRITGNQLSTMLVTLPVHVSDPGQRVALIRQATMIAKENYQLLGPETVGFWVDYAPPTAARLTFLWMSRRRRKNPLFNLTVSNVPGPRERGRVAGAVVSEIYSVGPLAAGSGMNITVWSYVDQLNIAVIADDVTLGDAHEATDAVLRAFAEIRRSIGAESTISEVHTALPPATAAN